MSKLETFFDNLERNLNTDKKWKMFGLQNQYKNMTTKYNGLLEVPSPYKDQ